MKPGDLLVRKWCDRLDVLGILVSEPERPIAGKWPTRYVCLSPEGKIYSYHSDPGFTIMSAEDYNEE